MKKIMGENSFLRHKFIDVANRESRLRIFAEKLADHGVIWVKDLPNYSEEEIFNIAPTSDLNKERFRSLVKSIGVTLKPHHI